MQKETQFELWLKGCEINNTLLYCLDGKGDTGFYKTISTYEYNHNYYFDTPVYHVWIKGKFITACANFYSALATWNNRCEELTDEQ